MSKHMAETKAIEVVSSKDSPASSGDSCGRHDSSDLGLDNNAPQCPPHTTERALVRKIDRRLLPMLCLTYLMAFLDR